MIVFLQSSIHLLSAMSTNTSMLLLFTLWASIQDGLGLSLVKQLEVEAAEGVLTHRVRTKRCACSSQMDSECHYFCHLDIIWVNTASKTTIYGLGAPSRHKRSIFRCTCADTNDETCTNFCHHRPEVTSPLRSRKRPLNILSILWSKRVLGKPVSAEALRTQRASLLRQREREESSKHLNK